jgi:hypothetical protein
MVGEKSARAIGAQLERALAAAIRVCWGDPDFVSGTGDYLSGNG